MAFIRAAVIGYPVKHSKSPLIHNHWIETHGLSGEYGRVEIAPEELRERIAN
ncbi:MAG: shikimate dehydrogenase, partial [Micavibrio aeruginosavorus]